MKKDNYVYYATIDANKFFGFDAYTDPETGEIIYITNRKDQDGNPVKRRFHWSPDRRMMRIPQTQKEVINFIDNSPYEKNSPNLIGRPKIQKIDEHGNAKVAVETVRLKNKAENEALKLKNDKLRFIAAILGENSEDSELQLFKVVEYAGKNPKTFLEDILGDPNLEALGLLNIALSNQVVDTKGSVYLWKKQKLGLNQRDAVAYLMNNQDVMEGIKTELKVLNVKL